MVDSLTPVQMQATGIAIQLQLQLQIGEPGMRLERAQSIQLPIPGKELIIRLLLCG